MSEKFTQDVVVCRFSLHLMLWFTGNMSEKFTLFIAAATMLIVNHWQIGDGTLLASVLA